MQINLSYDELVNLIMSPKRDNDVGEVTINLNTLGNCKIPLIKAYMTAMKLRGFDCSLSEAKNTIESGRFTLPPHIVSDFINSLVASFNSYYRPQP